MDTDTGASICLLVAVAAVVGSTVSHGQTEQLALLSECTSSAFTDSLKRGKWRVRTAESASKEEDWTFGGGSKYIRIYNIISSSRGTKTTVETEQRDTVVVVINSSSGK